MKRTTLFIYLILYTISGYSGPAQITCILNQLTEKRQTPESKLVDEFYLKNSNSNKYIDYHINFERVEQYFENLPQIYPNQVTIKTIGEFEGERLKRVDIKGWGNTEKKKVIISAGTHGNESGSIGTVINTLERIIHNPQIRNNYDITIIPYVNPRGTILNTRKTGEGIDVNRSMGGVRWHKIKRNEFVRDLLLKEINKKADKKLTENDIQMFFDELIRSQPNAHEMRKIKQLRKVYLKALKGKSSLNKTELINATPQVLQTELKTLTLLKNEFKGEQFDLGLDLHEAPFREKFFVVKSKKNDKKLTRKSLSHLPESELITSPDGKYPGIMYRVAPPGKPQPEKVPKNKSYTLYSPGEVSSGNVGTVKTFYSRELGANEHAYTLEGPGQYDLEDKIRIYSDMLENYLLEFQKMSSDSSIDWDNNIINAPTFWIYKKIIGIPLE